MDLIQDRHHHCSNIWIQSKTEGWDEHLISLVPLATCEPTRVPPWMNEAELSTADLRCSPCSHVCSPPGRRPEEHDAAPVHQHKRLSSPDRRQHHMLTMSHTTFPSTHPGHSCCPYEGPPALCSSHGFSGSRGSRSDRWCRVWWALSSSLTPRCPARVRPWTEEEGDEEKEEGWRRCGVMLVVTGAYMHHWSLAGHGRELGDGRIRWVPALASSSATPCAPASRREPWCWHALAWCRLKMRLSITTGRIWCENCCHPCPAC